MYCKTSTLYQLYALPFITLRLLQFCQMAPEYEKHLICNNKTLSTHSTLLWYSKQLRVSAVRDNLQQPACFRNIRRRKSYSCSHTSSSSSSSPPPPPPSSSSSIGTTAHSGLWPVEQCPSIFSYLPQLSPSSHSQHSKISFYFLFPSFPGSSPSSRPFQFLSEDLLGILSSSILSR